jgi:effector-binding domain-containing protein
MGDYFIEELSFPRVKVLRKRVKDSFNAMGRLIGSLYGEAAARRLKPAGAVFCIYYEKPSDPRSVDYEVCLPVEGAAGDMEGVEEMGGETCLRIVYKGPYKGISGVYDALGAHIEDENRRVIAPPREVYRRGPLFGFLPWGLVTEVWFPVAG